MQKCTRVCSTVATLAKLKRLSTVFVSAAGLIATPTCTRTCARLPASLGRSRPPLQTQILFCILSTLRQEAFRGVWGVRGALRVGGTRRAPCSQTRRHLSGLLRRVYGPAVRCTIPRRVGCLRSQRAGTGAVPQAHSRPCLTASAAALRDAACSALHGGETTTAPRSAPETSTGAYSLHLRRLS